SHLFQRPASFRKRGVFIQSASALRAIYPSGVNLVAGQHSGLDVVVDVAVEEPGADVVGHHVGHHHLGGKNVEDIGPHSSHGEERVAVPVGGMEINLGSHGHQVPAHILSLLHGHGLQREVAVDIAVH